MMTRISFANPKEVAPPNGWSQVVSVDGPQRILYVSGQVSTDAKGQTLGLGDLEAQTRQAYKNLLAVLRSQGASLNDVVKMNTYTTQPENVATIRKVRVEFFGGGVFPAATLVGVTALADPTWLVEVEAIAVIRK
jgi:enamine deaminase RidA (YjgF/YER057c/UK114 family)